MDVRVVDASALGSLVFGEPGAEKVADQLTGYLLMGPQLLWYELASIGLKKIRNYPEQSSQIRKAFQLEAPSLPIKMVEVEHSEVIELAREAGLTTYDASYLWLARKFRGSLFTLDRALKKSAHRYDVPA